ncbi:hypothetical protein Ddye_008048 [Dipteronia dyeriana]|uniref:Uncharacterized protein n=1 Tax=Dipteronia dyeriana TaxID=168575 RepID=A0AAD9X963_9ROSI|nr:hypothetical protein Ddye_008048 [Dipteronia dyeriana]
MANNSSKNVHIKLSSVVSIRRTQANKIQNLVEYTYIPESAQIKETSLPLLNPYTVFKRSKSLARKVTSLVQHRAPPIKEYIQSTALDNCLVSTSTDKQKGLPVTAIIALLNTVYKKYEHAVIGTCLSTLNAGSISLTYYLNFNIPLRDQNLHNCLKVQLQILGAPILRAIMLPNSYMATLHHQIAYRLQDHAIDLPIPCHTRDTLFIKAEREDEVPTIIQIPKQLPKKSSHKSCLSIGSPIMRKPSKTPSQSLLLTQNSQNSIEPPMSLSPLKKLLLALLTLHLFFKYL